VVPVGVHRNSGADLSAGAAVGPTSLHLQRSAFFELKVHGVQRTPRQVDGQVKALVVLGRSPWGGQVQEGGRREDPGDRAMRLPWVPWIPPGRIRIRWKFIR